MRRHDGGVRPTGGVDDDLRARGAVVGCADRAARGNRRTGRFWGCHREQRARPQREISFAFDTGAETVTLSHEGGQSFAASLVRLVGPAGELNDLDDWGGGDGRVTGGEQFTVDLSGPPGVVGGDTIRVV